MEKRNVSHDFRFKKADEIRNDLLEEIKHNELMSEKHGKMCRALNYFEHFLAFLSVVTSWVSIWAFTSLFGVSLDIPSSTVGLKNYAITTGIKKQKSAIKKKRKMHN